MAPISPGPVGRAQRKAKKLTETTNLHRFEPFTRRISRLKIDPVHTVERRKPSNDETDLTQGYFRTALEEWAELNLSQTFTSFLNKASPLSENIPQLLHHADTIFDLLIQHIEKRDALALEPLLSLVAHLAHDLGQRFEQYFARAVTLVAQVAASHDSAEVIEWCFTCLAWMFKYLSRLLVQDLRPLLDIMMPYLSAKKEYIVRFSAESLAFLLRKAAVMYQKRKAPLTLALKHLMGGHVPTDESAAAMHSYQIGVMSLCVESARGLEGSLHSSADSLVRCLLEVVVPICEQEVFQSTVEGVLVALAHETDSAGFQPVLDVVLDVVRQCTTSNDESRVRFALRLLNVVMGTRKGSRIADWKAVIQTYLDIAQTLQERPGTRSQVRRELVAIAATTIAFAPMDQLLPYAQKILKIVTEQSSPSEYFSFCTICAELGKERFIDLVLPTLQQYIVTHWSDDEVSTHYLLEKLQRDGIVSTRREGANLLDCPADLQAFLARELAHQNGDEVDVSVAQFAGRLHLPHNVRFPPKSEHAANLLPIYRNMIVRALQEPDTDADLRRRVILGWGLETYLDIVGDDNSQLTDLPQHILNTSPVHFRLPTFLSMSNRLFERANIEPAVSERNLDSVRGVLIQNMLSTSIPLKKESLKVLSGLKVPGKEDWLSETTELMLDILHAPYTPSEARKIAMLLRRLPQRQTSLGSESVLENLLPFFCLGLLSHYFDRTRQEVCKVLAQMVEATSVEESVVNIAIQWLQTPSPLQRLRQELDDRPRAMASAFQCTNLAQVDCLCERTLEEFDHSEAGLLAIIDDDHALENARTPESGRSLALQVLSSIPISAERRSRLLVPIFLSASMTRSQVQQKASSDTSASSNTLSPDIDDSEWSLSDRKAFLTLFSKFVNPRVLFRASDVYAKLVDLLSNGNLDVRKLALQAVIAWKEPTISRYESILFHVAEDKLSTTELGALLSAEEDESTIKPEDRTVVLPILLRLVFGLIVGRAGTAGSQEARRKSIIRTLFRMKEEEIAIFLDIALGALRNVQIPRDGLELLSQSMVIAEDQQYGFLRLLLSILETLQSRFASYGEQVMPAVIFCVIRASQQSDPLATTSSSGLARNIRRVGFQCLVLLSQNCPDINWSRYLPTLFAEAISPRLNIFASETNQGISGLLKLFSSWARSNETIGFFVDYDERVTDVLWQSLSTESAQKEVKVFVLEDIVQPWMDLAEDESVIPNRGRQLFEAKSDCLLDALLSLLDPTPPKEILSAITSILPRIAAFAKSSSSKEATIRLLTNLLRDSSHRIPPNIKRQLLLSIQSFLSATDDLGDKDTQSGLFGTISSLFDYFKDEANRQILCQVLARLSDFDADLIPAAQICHDLHAISTQHLDEIDYDTRLRAFQTLSSLEFENTSGKMWQPIVYSLLFFVRATEDFSIRSNALSCLKQFIIKACKAQNPDLDALLRNVILPSARRGLRAESELVRADFVSIYGLLVQHVQNDPSLDNLTVLLVGNDEEASFFSNILHIQQHRRLRAIRRLVAEVEKGIISAQNISDLFIPLLEMFVYDVGTDETAQSTKGQSILAMGTLFQWIDWKHFKGLFRKYKNDIGSANGDQKPTSRLLGHAADALLSAGNYKPEDGEQKPIPHVAKSLPDSNVIQNELRTQFIPKLAELVHYKDETEISFRIPIAVTIIKLITMLPREEAHLLAAPVVLDIAHILRSRTQESRDVARNALCQIVLLLGPSSLQFVLKEMRTALTRGYQLHVLSFTLHAILVFITPHTKLGDLDYCVDELVAVVMDDIFGAVGQEKDNQDYISSMKEVKSSKSYDSMELLAKTISTQSLSRLVVPIQTLLVGTMTTKQVRQVDELLRRLGMGLSQNPGASKRDLLVFAYQLIQTIYKEKEFKSEPRRTTLDEKSRQRYLIQMSAANKTTTGQTSHLLYKLARFALDLVRSILQKHNEVLTVENIHGFLPVVGDALVEAQEDVKISALRLLSAIVKLPMPELDQNGALYVMEAVKVVRNCTNTNGEAAQAALKFVAAMLRERKSVKVKDSDLAELLHRLTPDIEEPDKQGVTFNFIRAVMTRKIQLPEIYELVDKIGIMMVTNQNKGARDIARGVYVHFLLEYPQSSARWSKQQKFLLKNLEYDYPEGRESVMEAINTLTLKTKGSAAQDLISTFFIPIVLRMVNDENKGCREMAGVLLGQIFRSADQSHLKELLEPLKSWVGQDENVALQKVSWQAYNVLLTSDVALDREEISNIRDNLGRILQASLASDEDDDDQEWELCFQALLCLSKLVDTHPDAVLTPKQAQIWSAVWKLLRHANPWIQGTAAALTCDFFRHCVDADRSKLPLTCDHGLRFESDSFLQTLRAAVRILRRTERNEDLSSQVVQILLFLGQCMNVNGLTIEVADRQANDEDGDVMDAGAASDEDDHAVTRTKKISGLQYLLDQVARILRIETTSLTSAALLPKKSSMVLLSNLIPALALDHLSGTQIHDILAPLQHLTDPSTVPPRSADPTFAATYQGLIELAHEVMEKVQGRLGDAEYVRVVTEVNRLMRRRREERRTKRRIERVAEPERAAREKKRKSDRKKERNREIARTHQRRRKEVG